MNALAGVLKHSGRVPYKVTGVFFLDLMFSKAGFLLCCCGEAVWRLGQQQHARSLFLLPSVRDLVDVALTAALQFPSRGSIMAFISGST